MKKIISLLIIASSSILFAETKADFNSCSEGEYYFSRDGQIDFYTERADEFLRLANSLVVQCLQESSSNQEIAKDLKKSKNLCDKYANALRKFDAQTTEEFKSMKNTLQAACYIKAVGTTTSLSFMDGLVVNSNTKN